MLFKINGILTILLFVMLLGNIGGCYVDTSDTDDEATRHAARGQNHHR